MDTSWIIGQNKQYIYSTTTAVFIIVTQICVISIRVSYNNLIVFNTYKISFFSKPIQADPFKVRYSLIQKVLTFLFRTLKCFNSLTIFIPPIILILKPYFCR